jgi:hypothetical protein
MLVKHTSDCRSNRWSHIRDLVLIQFRAALVINVVCFSNWTWWAIIWVVIMILIVTWSTVNTAIILSAIFNVLPVVKNVTKCMSELDQGHLLIPLSWKWFSKSVLILYEGYFFSSISITVCINSNFILVNCPHYHTLPCIN